MTMPDPNRPDLDHPRRPQPEDFKSELVKQEEREGMGAILGVVAVAALIIIGMLYIMSPPVDSPRSVSSEAPGTTAPSPAPTPGQTK